MSYIHTYIFNRGNWYSVYLFQGILSFAPVEPSMPMQTTLLQMPCRSNVPARLSSAKLHHEYVEASVAARVLDSVGTSNFIGLKSAYKLHLATRLPRPVYLKLPLCQQSCCSVPASFRSVCQTQKSKLEGDFRWEMSPDNLAGKLQQAYAAFTMRSCRAAAVSSFYHEDCMEGLCFWIKYDKKSCANLNIFLLQQATIAR